MQLLGGMDPARFLAEHWQKKPLLVRQAVPRFEGILTPAQLCGLATRKDVAARVVHTQPARSAKGGVRYVVEHAPLPRDTLEPGTAPSAPWSVLVQGVEGLVEGGWEVLQRFSFLPTARIDDLMVSYATVDGGVGPHFDLYDVFLLQGPGRRRWKISTDKSLTSGLGRALPPFTATDEWVLEAGDMLYLPPRVAHWGIAVDPCMTYSIGLLAPTHEQIIGNLTAFLAQRAAPTAMYTDPDLRPAPRPAEIDDAMMARVVDAVALEEFWGRYLTGPKPGVRFQKPKVPVDVTKARTVELARHSRMLYRGRWVFINGEAVVSSSELLRALADKRRGRLPSPMEPGDAAVLSFMAKRGYAIFK